MNTINHRKTLFCGALLGATGVVLGAFGAHFLRARLAAAGQEEVWATAVHFQMIHAVALIALAAWMRVARTGDEERGRTATRWTARLWISGTVLFSGSLYLLAALGGPPWLGPVTPIGGALMIAGWASLAAAAAA